MDGHGRGGRRDDAAGAEHQHRQHRPSIDRPGFPLRRVGHRLGGDWISGDPGGAAAHRRPRGRSVRAPACVGGGNPHHAPLLARAAVAAGVDAIFLECHPDPASSLSDRSTIQLLDRMPALLGQLAEIRRVVVQK